MWPIVWCGLIFATIISSKVECIIIFSHIPFDQHHHQLSDERSQAGTVIEAKRLQPQQPMKNTISNGANYLILHCCCCFDLSLLFVSGSYRQPAQHQLQVIGNCARMDTYSSKANSHDEDTNEQLGSNDNNKKVAVLAISAAHRPRKQCRATRQQHLSVEHCGAETTTISIWITRAKGNRRDHTSCGLICLCRAAWTRHLNTAHCWWIITMTKRWCGGVAKSAKQCGDEVKYHKTLNNQQSEHFKVLSRSLNGCVTV